MAKRVGLIKKKNDVSAKDGKKKNKEKDDNTIGEKAGGK